MGHQVALQIPTTTFLELASYLHEYGDERDPSQIATLAIDAWLAIAKGAIAYSPAKRGYQWKDLFLPERTEVRMQYSGTYAYANVVDDALICEGHAVTPSQFAALIGGLGRNAWRDLWLRLPGTRQWKKAAYLRLDQNKLAHERERPYRFDTPETAPAVMATSLKNALALVEKVAEHRRGVLSRRTDLMPDD